MNKAGWRILRPLGFRGVLIHVAANLALAHIGRDEDQLVRTAVPLPQDVFRLTCAVAITPGEHQSLGAGGSVQRSIFRVAHGT